MVGFIKEKKKKNLLTIRLNRCEALYKALCIQYLNPQENPISEMRKQTQRG